jgi:hypothetical protein
MKKITFILIACFWGSFASVLTAQTNMQKKVRELSQRMMDATMNRDYKTVLDFTHPKIIEMMGGKAKALELTSREMEKVNESGGIEECKIKDVSEIVKVGNQLQCIISQEMIMKIEGSRYRIAGGTVGISDDKGKNWTFLNIQENNINSIRRFIPKFSDKLKLPEKAFEIIESKD